jgi:pimeloyl-ACP methyl ester carboxylesterase
VKILRHSILVQDLSMRYEEVAGKGEPLVLIHGLAESTRVWYRNVPALAERYHVYLVDLPGFGSMRHLRQQFNLHECAAWLDGWMQAVGLTTAHLVGHSMGGYVAMALAALRPEKIQRLVLVDSIGAPFDKVNNFKQGQYQALKAIGRTTPTFWPYIAYDYLRAGPAMVLKAAQQILALDAAEVMTSVHAPTLLIWGAEDDLVPLAMSRPLHEKLAGSRLLILPRANHFCMFEQSHAFNDAVLRFLQGKEIGVTDAGVSRKEG